MSRSRQLVIFSGSILLFLSCGEQPPKIDYNNITDTTAVTDASTVDTTKMLVADLPVKFDSLPILLFPIAAVDLQENGRYGKIRSESYSNSEIAASYFSQNTLTGNFVNIVFQDKDGNERKLTNKKIRIREVNFLNEIFTKTKTGYLLYMVYDRDTNGDNELDRSDLQALYISYADGTGFTKISRELHQFYDYRLIKELNKIYFRTLEDANKDGLLNNKDNFHYYYIDFTSQAWTVTEYNPLKVLQ